MSWIADNYLKFALIVLVVFAFFIRGDLFPGEESSEQAASSSPRAVAESTTGGDSAVAGDDAGDDAGDESASAAAEPGQADAAAASSAAEGEASSESASATAAEPVTGAETAPETAAAAAAAPAAEPAAPQQPVSGTKTVSADYRFGGKSAAPTAAGHPVPATAPVMAPPPVAPVASAPREHSASEYWVAARTAFWLGNYPVAEQEYANLLSREPGNWQAHKELGNLYARTRRFDRAVEAYQQATLILNEAEMFEESRELAVIMAELYPAWKDKPIKGLNH